MIYDYIYTHIHMYVYTVPSSLLQAQFETLFCEILREHLGHEKEQAAYLLKEAESCAAAVLDHKALYWESGAADSTKPNDAEKQNQAE